MNGGSFSGDDNDSFGTEIYAARYVYNAGTNNTAIYRKNGQNALPY
jgi:hypothetical protein